MSVSGGAQIERLSEFVRTLERLLDWEFDLEDFDDRVRLQKYVFLADEFGFEHGYNYNMYHYGPYSPDVAREYYEEEFEDQKENSRTTDKLDSERFVDLVSDRSRVWLEVAATVRSLYRRYSRQDVKGSKEEAIQKAAEIKKADLADVEEIFTSLQNMNAL